MGKKIHEEFMKVVSALVEKKLGEEDIEIVVLGGSVARGDETEYSDIDINFYFVKDKLPKFYGKFYEFMGKWIEEYYFDVEDLKGKSLLPEVLILYDKNGVAKKNKFDKKIARKDFEVQLKEALKYQELIEKSFESGNHEESFYYLYSIESPSYVLMHALPPRFGLPFPSFRLLDSLKKIDEKHGSKTYDLVEKIYDFENSDVEGILKKFEEAYLLMNKIRREENTEIENLGFYDELKIRYNIEGLRRTFEKYPFVFAYRFIVGCLAMWAFDESIDVKNRENLVGILFNVVGVEEISEELVREKVDLSRGLIDEVKKLIYV